MRCGQPVVIAAGRTLRLRRSKELSSPAPRTADPTAALLDVYVHALVLDPTGPIGLVHSNAIVLRIGL